MAPVQLSRSVAQALGYEFINTDDCWSQKNFDPQTKLSGRGPDGRILPAPTFANSSAQMREMAAYIKSKGMKFGIYGAAGQTTCASRVGGLYHERIDAQTYADCAPRTLPTPHSALGEDSRALSDDNMEFSGVRVG